jgi:DNA-binding transcriptional MerR regulator
VDVARQAGYSVQQIRNLERDGALPLSARTPAGYRTYTATHVHAAMAYRAFAAAVGPVEAKQIMRTVHQAPAAELLALLDAAHARLHVERRDLRLARQAAAAIAGEPVDDARPSDSMSISELASALGLRASALRHWEAEGLIISSRSTAHGMRTYAPSAVRDARIVHQLRQAGYRIPQLQALMPQLRHARRWDEVSDALAAREVTLNTRSGHLLQGAAALQALLDISAVFDRYA